MFTVPKRNFISATLATIGALSVSIMLALAKNLSPDIPTKFVVFMTSSFCLIFFIPILISNTKTVVKTGMLYFHILRVIIGFAAMICSYYAYRNLPVAFATSIGMSSPLFTTILSVILLKENTNMTKWLIIALGYLGVLILIRPMSFCLDLGTVSAVLSNILSACIIIITKVLSRYDSTVTMMLYANVGATIIAFLFNIHDWHIIAIKDLILLFFMGLLTIIIQLCSITALKYSGPSFIAPFEYTRMFFAILIGLIMFSEIPDICTILGSVVILVSVYTLTYLDHNGSRKLDKKLEKGVEA